MPQASAGVGRCLALVALIALSPGRTTFADLLYFSKGGEVQSPARVDGSKILVESPVGDFEFRPADFRRRVAGHSPSQEWETRRASATRGGAELRYQAAWWALENGLTKEAVELFRDASTRDPVHPATARILAVLNRLERPVSDPDSQVLRGSLGERARVARGPHVLLLHQHTDAEAAERVELLEQVVTSFYVLFAAQGLELKVPEHRMASAWFADREDYRAFLKSQHAEAFRTTRGYFHPTLNAVVAYDSRCAGEQKAARDAIDRRRIELGKFEEMLRRMPPGSRLRYEVPGEPTRLLSAGRAQATDDDLHRDLLRRQLLHELEWRSIDLGTAAHEMIHQLVAASGLTRGHDDFPIWLHEGLAAQFEVIRGGRWAGIGRAHDLRLPDWRSLQPRPSLLPLIEDQGFGKGYRRDLYAEAWALVYYLRKERPTDFLAWIDRLRAPESREPDPGNRVVSVFQHAFDRDLDATERSWHAFMATVRTPLEEGRASPDLGQAKPQSIRSRD